MAPPGGSKASKPPVGPPSSYNHSFASTRCRCCPYGFHIDLDFVKFAETVTSGNNYVQKWNTAPRRISTKKLNHSTTDLNRPKPVYRGAHSFDASEDWINPDSTMDSTIMSTSTVGYLTEDEQPTNDFETFRNGYELGKQRSDSQVLKLIHELNGLENQRRTHISSPISSSTPYPNIADSFQQKISSGWNSDGSASVNAEVQEILSKNQQLSQQQQHFGRDISKVINSEPTSPTPMRSYHLSVAHAAQRKLSQPQTSVQQQSIPETQPSPPRRYFDSARPRVLSPEPGVRDLNFPPSMLRTSNLHSRSYFSPSISTTTRMPYRERSGVNSSFSSSLNFDSFASVRRQRTSTDESGYRQRTFSPTGRSVKLDGYTSDAEYRSNRYEMSPPPPTEQNKKSINIPVDYIDSTSTKKSINPFINEIVVENNLSKDEFKEKIFDTKDTQTVIPQYKNIGTESERPSSTTQETQTILDEDGKHVSTDTEDLITEEIIELQKLQKELTDIKSNLPEVPFKEKYSIEFQFCIGHEPEHAPGEEPYLAKKKVEVKDVGTDAVKKAIFDIGINTMQITKADKACMPMPPPVMPKRAEKGINVSMDEKITNTIQTQTEEDTNVVNENKLDIISTEIQTDDDWIEEEVKRRLVAEKAERKSVDKITETEEDSGEFIMVTCSKCDQQSTVVDGHEHYQKIEVVENESENDPPSQTDSINDHESGFSNSSTDLEEFERIEKAIQEEELNKGVQLRNKTEELPPEPLIRNSMPPDPEYSDHDTVSLDTVSINTMIMVEPPKKTPSPPLVKTIDPSKIEALRKLLTEPRQHFTRDSGAYRSQRAPKAKTTDDLEYIASKHGENKNDSEPSMPSENSQTALTDVVVLKKAIPLPTSPIPEPVPAKIPRPKISKYSMPVEQASTPDEEAEAVDKLTPLRSELRSLAAWGAGGGDPWRNQAEYRRYAAQQRSYQQHSDDEIEGEIQTSEASTDSDGTYDLTDDEDIETEFEITEPLKEALSTLNNHLMNPDSVATQAVEWANKYVQHEWLKVTTKKKAKAKWVEGFLDAIDKDFSTYLMELIVNFVDNNGNAALHYAVSHENYDLISVLLDSKVCDVDKMNHAGYSPLMLGSLCEIENETQSTIIQRLFEIGDVNAKSIKHGQTALHLASSHGRIKTTQLLLDCGADVNIQDIDGSTALMCCVEHGHKEITKMLLNNSNIDASLTDCDNQTALSIAIEQKHKSLAVLIYAHLNFTRYQNSEH